MKRMCSTCRKAKEETEFRYMTHKSKYQAYCRECEKVYQRNYQIAYRERKRSKNDE